MPSSQDTSLETIVRTIARGPVFGLRSGLPHEGASDALKVARFEDRVWTLDVDSEELALPTELLAAVEEQPECCVFAEVCANERKLVVNSPTGRLRGCGALIHTILRQLPVGTHVLFLAPVGLALTRTHELMRSHLEQQHYLQTIVFTDGRLIPGVHSAMRFVLTEVEAGSPTGSVLRLVDLSACEPTQWRSELRSAQKREGGEKGHSIVLRDAQMGTRPWIYELHTRDYQASLEDARVLGEFRPLAELVDEVVVGLMPPRDQAVLVELDDETESPRGMVPVLGGRDVRPNEISPSGRQWTKRVDIPPRKLFRSGDVLIRRMSIGGLIAATVPPGAEGTYNSSLLLLRWKADVPAHTRELLISYLMSNRVQQALSTMGPPLRVEARALLDLEVPYPNERIGRALGALAEMEAWYRDRAESVQAVRQTIFEADSYADAVPLVLQAQHAEGERIGAAKDSQRFEYRVRNHFPHPIALRYERLATEPHGKDRIEQTLECAEHLLHYLAVLGMVQLKAAGASSPIPSRHLSSAVARGPLRFDWGISHGIVKEALSTSQSRDTLSLPAPQFSQIRSLVGTDDSDAAIAERELRRQRNDWSHLQRPPAIELPALSETLAGHLASIAKAAQFIADVALVFVKDYSRHPVSGERSATLDYLRGSGVVFERRAVPVVDELPRGALGILGNDGHFHTLAPWLIHHTCTECKRPEVFLFNRYEKGVTKFVAMETGHTYETSEMATKFEKLVDACRGKDEL